MVKSELGPRLQPRSGRLKSHRKTLALTLMVLPGVIWLILIRYLPMFGILISFKDYRLPDPLYSRQYGYLQDIINRDWVGLDNFKMLFSSPMTAKFIRNTLLYNVTFIILGLVIAVAFAIMLTELTAKRTAKVYQTFMFFPYFISWVVASYFLYAFLAPGKGVIEPAVFGLTNFYQEAEPWPFIMIISNVWKMTGYSTILYLAAITGIDPSQYEAAGIDGATKWQQIVHVTLPHLRTIIIILFIMNVGRIFNSDFGQFWALPINGGGGVVPNATETVDTYTFRLLSSSINIGVSTAVGLLQNVIGFICIMIANTIVRKVDKDSALF